MIGVIISNIWKIALFLIWGAILAGIIYFASWFFMFNKVVIKRKVTADGKVVKLDKEPAYEAYDKKLGIWCWKLPKSRKIIPKPALRHVVLFKKKECCEVWEDSSGDMHPTASLKKKIWDENKTVIANFRAGVKSVLKGKEYEYDPKIKFSETADIDEALEIRPVPENRKALHLQQNKVIAEKARASADFWLRYAPVLVPVAMFLFMFLSIFFFAQYIGAGMSDTATAMNQMATSCRP